MALGEGIDLVRPIDCARLSFHGGSLLAGFRPGLVTTRLPRAVRSRRSQISTVNRTSPLRQKSRASVRSKGSSKGSSFMGNIGFSCSIRSPADT
jgi:hypothetical protein